MKKAFKGFLASLAVVLVLFSGGLYVDALELKVEGAGDTLYSQEIEAVDGQTAEEVFRQALGEENFKGSTSEYGFMVEEVLGEVHTWASDSAYWELLVDMGDGYQSSVLGLSGVKISGDVEGIMLHTNKNTGIPVISCENGYIKLEKKVFDWATSKDVFSPVAGADVEIDGNSYTTDENGLAKVDLTAGSYTANVSKQTADGYPEVLRLPLEFEFTELESLEKNIDDYEMLKTMTVESEKEFTVEFSVDADESTAKSGIYAVDSNGKIVSLDVSVEGANATVSAPLGGYAPGEYNLIVEKEIQSASGAVLDKAVRLVFTVE